MMKYFYRLLGSWLLFFKLWRRYLQVSAERDWLETENKLLRAQLGLQKKEP